MGVLKQKHVFEEQLPVVNKPISGLKQRLSYADADDVLVLGQESLESLVKQSEEAQDIQLVAEQEPLDIESPKLDLTDEPKQDTQDLTPDVLQQDILETVRQQAYAEGQKDAQAEYQHQLDQAFQKGLAEGASKEDHSKLLEHSFEDGVAQGKEDAKRIVAEKCDDILAQIDQFIKEKNQLLADAKKPMVDFSIAMADRLVQTRIETDQSLVLALVDEGIQKLLESDKVLIRVNRDHFEFFKANQQYFQERLPHIKTILFQEDNTLSDGCVFETDLGFVDSTLSVKVEYLRDAMHHNDLHK